MFMQNAPPAMHNGPADMLPEACQGHSPNFSCDTTTAFPAAVNITYAIGSCVLQRFDDLLTADSKAGKAAAADLAADCCADIAQIEAQLLAVYTDAKASALDDALEECASDSTPVQPDVLSVTCKCLACSAVCLSAVKEGRRVVDQQSNARLRSVLPLLPVVPLRRYFFGDGTRWDVLPAPLGLRDAAPELLAYLATVEAEVTKFAVRPSNRSCTRILIHIASPPHEVPNATQICSAIPPCVLPPASQGLTTCPLMCCWSARQRAALEHLLASARIRCRLSARTQWNRST